MNNYEEWKAFYEGRITDWMTTDELRLRVGGLLGSYPDSTEVLLIHAMHRVEELEFALRAQELLTIFKGEDCQ